MPTQKILVKKYVCPSCSKRCRLSVASLVVFFEVCRILKKRRALKRINLLRRTVAIGAAPRWVKEVLDTAIAQGCLVQDPKTEVIRAA